MSTYIRGRINQSIGTDCKMFVNSVQTQSTKHNVPSGIPRICKTIHVADSSLVKAWGYFECLSLTDIPFGQFCTQLTKAHMAELSCNNQLL